MSKIHYFQRYNQKEDVATNNTMLLFSRLYNESTYKFNEFLNALMGELQESNQLDIGITFTQQEKAKSSRPDGSISQNSFKIVIETKPDSGKFFGKRQLINHLESFKNEETKILVALAPTPMKESMLKEVSKEGARKGVNLVNFTFKDIIEIFRGIIAPYDFQLKEIIDEYEDYCVQEGLLKDVDSRIRIVPCGGSLELNLKYAMHYMPANRGITEHGYFGVYNDKRVKGIGKVSNMIVAEVSPVDEVISIKVLEEKYPLTTEQYERVIGMIKETREKIGWGLDDCPHRYTIVDKFYDTDYKKESKGGIMGHRYQNLKDILDVSELPCDEEIAKKLRDKVWE